MRLPNGFGNVSKLPGNRRKPYRVRVTVGWELDTETGNRVGDMLVFSRIRALAQAGKIEIVQDAPTYRDMTIRKVGS